MIRVHSQSSSSSFLRDWKDYTKKHNFMIGQAFFADGQLIERKYTWDNILLPGEIRRTIQLHVESFLQNRDALKKYKLKARRGLIIEGPPGTGKTLLGKILANCLEASFIWVSPRHIENLTSFASSMSLARYVAPSVCSFSKTWTYLGKNARRDLGSD